MPDDLSQTKLDYPKLVWEAASSLTSASISAAMGRARSLGFSEAELQIPLEETIANLEHSRDVILDLVAKGRVVQIPLKIQNRLLQETNKVSNTLAGLTSGKDLLKVLEASVEDLNATIWQFNLQNQSDSVLGFERKMNELKNQSVAAHRALTRAKKLEGRLDEIEELVRKIETLKSTAQEHEEKATQALGALQSKEVEAEETFLEIKANLALVKEHESAIASASILSRNAAAEVKTNATYADEAANEIEDTRTAYDALVSSITELKAELGKDVEEAITELRAQAADATKKSESTIDDMADVLNEADTARDEKATKQLASSVAAFKEVSDNLSEEYRLKYEQLESASKGLLQGHTDDVGEITNKLKAIEKEIDGAILRATGFTLFHSFQKRQEQLQASTLFWAKCLAGCVLGSVVASLIFLYFLGYFPSSGPALYFKISLSLPFLAAITFCGWQYTRERRLEEEYAFKSNISISLKPYLELVEDLIDKENPDERAKYTAFLITSINKVFTSPTGLVFDDKEAMPTDQAKSLLKAALEGATDVIKAKSGK